MQKDRINIFILAAGRGERLRPITDHIPKPLIPVLGRPVLQHVLDRVSCLSFKGIGINAYYMKDEVGEWVANCSFKNEITLFQETGVIGTGGALKNAEEFLSNASFLVHNSDVLSDIDLNRLLEEHNSSGDLVTLAVHDHPKFNTVVLDENGSLSHLAKGGIKGGEQVMAFTGIAVYEPGFLKFLPEGGSSVVDAWLKAVSAGEKIGTFDVTGRYWTDIGTPASYASAVFKMLREEGEAIYVHPSITKCGDIEVQGHVVAEEGCDLGGTASIRNCILIPGPPLCPPLPRGGWGGENCIMGPGFRVPLEESDILDFDEEGRQLIGTGGSDRKYYRIRDGDRTTVLMRCGAADPDFERHIEYSGFFMEHGVPVPGLMNADPAKKLAVFEDAGDISLYSWLKWPRTNEEAEIIYRKAVDSAALMHTITGKGPLIDKRLFDRGHFRWETDYFVKRFVQGLRNINIDNMTWIEKELDALAARADSFPKTVMHRDLQSQNIMVMKDGLRLIDFQGARTGPPAYDMASLLWDPYHRLGEVIRGRLIEYYIERMYAGAVSFDRGMFRDSLVVCRLQRHMQALGAYGFLSKVKGKKYFLKYVPEGLRLLKEDIALCAGEYPVLNELIMGL